MHCNTRAYSPFGKLWRMLTNEVSAIWSSWMWDFLSVGMVIAISYSASEENKAVPDVGSASVGLG